MRFFSTLKAALLSLRESPTRAALSALGIAVGSFAIVTLISVARGVQNDVQKEVEDLGVNILIVIPTRIEDGQMFAPGLVGISLLEDQDLSRLKQVQGVIRGTPLTFVGSGLAYGDKKSNSTMIMALRPEWFEMRKTDLSEGRVYSVDERNLPVCVIGSLAKEKLFPNETALGKKISYNGVEYQVIGVTKSKEESNSLFSMGSFENAMFVPFDYVKSKQPTAQIDRLLLQTSPTVEPKTVVDAAERVMGERLNREAYSVLTQQDLLKLVFKLMEILTWLLTGLTSIGLIVGGVGIMTIMLMSVSERTKEIGIRKTVGAKGRDIFWHFLAEASILGLVGGIAGLVLSGVACWALLQFTPIKPLITIQTVALSFGVSIGVGGVFGIIPAIRAARRDPVASLRTE